MYELVHGELFLLKHNDIYFLKPVMSSVCVLHPVFVFCILRHVRRQNARRSPKCLEMLGTGREDVIGRGRKHTVC